MKTDVKRSLAPFLAMTLAPALAVASPVGGSIESGSGTISQVGNITNVQQDSANLLIDWQSFNIQVGEEVNFIQPSSNAIALNRDFSGAASEIFGDLNANGQVYLFNTAGVLIGADANINVAGLLVSDLSLSDSGFDDFIQSGSMSLQDVDEQQGGIVIEGAITTSTRSGITLIGQFIENSGTLTANSGNVNLAIGDGPIVVTNSSGTIGVQISQGITRDLSPSQVLFNNSGEIRANNGDIALNIHYLNSLNVLAVRNDGLINAVGIGYGNFR